MDFDIKNTYFEKLDKYTLKYIMSIKEDMELNDVDCMKSLINKIDDKLLLLDNLKGNINNIMQCHKKSLETNFAEHQKDKEKVDRNNSVIEDSCQQIEICKQQQEYLKRFDPEDLSICCQALNDKIVQYDNRVQICARDNDDCRIRKKFHIKQNAEAHKVITYLTGAIDKILDECKILEDKKHIYQNRIKDLCIKKVKKNQKNIKRSYTVTPKTLFT
jgi:hypothetical protein